MHLHAFLDAIWVPDSGMKEHSTYEPKSSCFTLVGPILHLVVGQVDVMMQRTMKIGCKTAIPQTLLQSCQTQNDGKKE